MGEGIRGGFQINGSFLFQLKHARPASMSKTFDLAFSRAAALPEPARERIARELLERIETLSRLRAEVEIGLDELDAGLGAPLDIEEEIRLARVEYAAG